LSCLGKTLLQGWRELKTQGLSLYRVKLTSPFPRALGSGTLRIVREKESAQGWEWVLAYSEYDKI